MAKTKTKNEEDIKQEKLMSTTLAKYADGVEIQHLLESGAIPSTIDTPEKLMTVMQTGREMGMGPMTTINNINVIKGKTVISSAGLGALLKRHGKEWVWTKDFVTEDGKQITELEFEWISEITGKPKNAKFSVSWQEMERAGFTTKDNWQRMPKNMLRARCMAYAVRALFPEILLGGGLYTDSEIVDSKIKGHENEQYDQIMNEEGQITIVPKEEVVEGDTNVEDVEEIQDTSEE